MGIELTSPPRESAGDQAWLDHANGIYTDEGVGIKGPPDASAALKVTGAATVTGKTTAQTLDRLEAAGVLASRRPPRQFRLVTNRHHTPEIIQEAVARVRSALAS